jgi:hypothetical protein
VSELLNSLLNVEAVVSELLNSILNVEAVVSELLNTEAARYSFELKVRIVSLQARKPISKYNMYQSPGLQFDLTIPNCHLNWKLELCHCKRASQFLNKTGPGIIKSGISV